MFFRALFLWSICRSVRVRWFTKVKVSFCFCRVRVFFCFPKVGAVRFFPCTLLPWGDEGVWSFWTLWGSVWIFNSAQSFSLISSAWSPNVSLPPCGTRAFSPLRFSPEYRVPYAIFITCAIVLFAWSDLYAAWNSCSLRWFHGFSRLSPVLLGGQLSSSRGLIARLPPPFTTLLL